MDFAEKMKDLVALRQQRESLEVLVYQVAAGKVPVEDLEPMAKDIFRYSLSDPIGPEEAAAINNKTREIAQKHYADTPELIADLIIGTQKRHYLAIIRIHKIDAVDPQRTHEDLQDRRQILEDHANSLLEEIGVHRGQLNQIYRGMLRAGLAPSKLQGAIESKISAGVPTTEPATEDELADFGREGLEATIAALENLAKANIKLARMELASLGFFLLHPEEMTKAFSGKGENILDTKRIAAANFVMALENDLRMAEELCSYALSVQLGQPSDQYKKAPDADDDQGGPPEPGSLH